MARIAIQTLGTRGDVQPYLALGQGLLARGHSVCLATSPQFAEAARRLGLCFAPLPGDLVDMLGTADGQMALAGGFKLPSLLRLLRDIRPMYRRLMRRPMGGGRGGGSDRRPSQGDCWLVHRREAEAAFLHGAAAPGALADPCFPEPAAALQRSRAAEPAKPPARHPLRRPIVSGKSAPLACRGSGPAANGVLVADERAARPEALSLQSRAPARARGLGPG